MASQARTPKYFQDYQQAARAAAATAGLDTPYFTMRERQDDDLVRTQIWRSRDLSVPLANVSGLWSVYLSYQFQHVPGDPSARLVRTSFGLDVHDVPFAQDKPLTLLRYDYDEFVDARYPDQDPPLRVHINVLQPDPLRDHVHLPAFRSEPWDAAEVMAWITSPRLLADLKRRLPA